MVWGRNGTSSETGPRRDYRSGGINCYSGFGGFLYSGCRRPGPAQKRADPNTITAAPGGGPGTVWLNEKSKVYHCSTDPYYGKTKSGKYVSEADAKAAGARPARGKGCS